jgi:hypothetical protein
MNVVSQPRYHNPMISLAIGILALAAASVGIFGNVYLEDDWFLSQMKGQDGLTWIIAAGLLVLPFIKNEKIKILQAGFFAYMAYTYIFYAFAVRFNVLFLLYVVLASLSVLGLFLVFRQLARFEGKGQRGWAIKGGSIYLLFVCSVLGLLWLADIIGRLAGKPLLENPTGEPLTPVYILDLGFVIPASLYGAVQALRKKFWGRIITGVMLIMVTTMGFALMAMALGLYAFGFGFQGFLTVFWFVLGTAGLLLALFYLRSLEA